MSGPYLQVDSSKLDITKSDPEAVFKHQAFSPRSDLPIVDSIRSIAFFLGTCRFGSVKRLLRFGCRKDHGAECKKTPLLTFVLKKVMTAGIALGWRKMDLVELKQRYVSVINRVDLWNPIDNSIFIDQNPIDSYTSRKLCTSSWHVYLNSPLCLHNQKTLLRNDQAWLCSLQPNFSQNYSNSLGVILPNNAAVGMKKIKIPSLPSHNPGKFFTPKKFNGNWKKNDLKILLNQQDSPNIQGLIFRWSSRYTSPRTRFTSVGWWSKPLRMGNAWKSPFPSI